MRASRWLGPALTAPALGLYALVLATPLVLMAFLSFRTGTGPDAAGFTIAHYAEVLGDGYFWGIYGRTLAMSLIVTAVSLLLGVPEAYILYRMQAPWRGFFLLLVLAPLLVAVVVRTLGWALLLGPSGPVAQALSGLGLVSGPVTLLQTMAGVVIALVHVLVPFVVIAVWANLQRCDPDALRAAESLGAGQLTVFARIVLPQIVPGALSAAVVVFSLAATAFATPAIVGGRRFKVVATAAYEEFLGSMNWPLGSALAVLLLLASVAVVVGINRAVERKYAQAFQA